MCSRYCIQVRAFVLLLLCVSALAKQGSLELRHLYYCCICWSLSLEGFVFWRGDICVTSVEARTPILGEMLAFDPSGAFELEPLCPVNFLDG